MGSANVRARVRACVQCARTVHGDNDAPLVVATLFVDRSATVVDAAVDIWRHVRYQQALVGHRVSASCSSHTYTATMSHVNNGRRVADRNVHLLRVHRTTNFEQLTAQRNGGGGPGRGRRSSGSGSDDSPLKPTGKMTRLPQF
jgi:hypothetical protein